MNHLAGATILLLGAGYSAREFARQVGPRAARVLGTTRTPEKAGALRTAGIDPLTFDGMSLSAELTAALRDVTHLVISASPNVFGDPLLRLIPGPLTAPMPRLRWAGYLSTVGVYGDHDGAWVDEASQTRPVSQRARQRVAAEEAWLVAGEAAGVPVSVLRLSGIYGPGRNALVNLERGTAKRTVKPGQVFNRIHVADIAGALAFLADRMRGGIFNVSDDEPGPPQDVVAYAAGLMGVAPPPEVPFDQVEMTPMARSFWADNKRVCNARLRAAGFDFRYPNHRVALDAMWADGSWRGEPADAGASE